ncbi:MAG: DUF5684 domain-containing protein [Chloroflexota bacterium]
MTVYDFIILAQQGDGAAAAAGGAFSSLVQLALSILAIAGLWQVFVKMGEAGWKAIIPIYNIYVIIENVGRPAWWIILLFVPFANIVILFLLFKDLAEGFGHGIGFTLGLFFLGFIFLPILGFGDSQWQGGKKKKMA